eukprot:360722-Chlamydomonas_euryale.AAC.6
MPCPFCCACRKTPILLQRALPGGHGRQLSGSQSATSKRCEGRYPAGTDSNSPARNRPQARGAKGATRRARTATLRLAIGHKPE